jgi:hypothetical protein
MAEVTQKHDFSSVFAMRAETVDLNERAHRQGWFLPTNPLTDRHSGHLTYFGLELSMASPDILFAFWGYGTANPGV